LLSAAGTGTIAPGKQSPCGVRSARSIRRSKLSTMHHLVLGHECLRSGEPKPVARGPEPCAICRSQEDGTTRTRDLQVSCSRSRRRRSTCGDHRWATEGLVSSEEGTGGIAPRGDAWCQPGLTDRDGATRQPRIKWCRNPKIPLARVNPRRRHLSRSSGALPFDRRPAEAAGDLLWESCGSTLIRYALSAPGGAPPVKAISRERLANRDVGARARPEGKIVSVTIAGRAGDLL
jgi:hypothetical protein